MNINDFEIDGFIVNPQDFNIKNLSKLNGNFSLLFNDENTTIAITDRFNSRELYIDKVNNKVIRFKDIDFSKYQINENAVFEFLVMQRTFGTKTIFRDLNLIPPASLVKIHRGEIVAFDKYWEFKHNHLNYSLFEASKILADLLIAAYKLYSKGIKEKGILLSGGLDSRLVLGVANDPDLMAYTIGDCINNEVLIAKSAANLYGIKHNYIKRPPNYYNLHFNKAVKMAFGKNMFAHAHFFLLEEQKNTTFFHGHGIDYLFRGTYLPKKRNNYFGVKTLKYSIDKSLNHDNIIDYYIKNSSFSLYKKGVLNIFNKSSRVEVLSNLKNSLKECIKELYKDKNISVLDVWEYLNYHDLSRHYTNLNLTSIRSVSSERTLIFENKLFDFYLSLPHQIKLNDRLIKETFKLIDYRLLEINDANTNEKPILSTYKLTFKKGLNKLLKSIFKKFDKNPKEKDKSWRSNKTLFSELNKEYENKLKISIIDEDQIKNSNVAVLLSLLTIDNIQNI